jgi:GNAT superfamily N-acetyltransferase
MPCSSLLCADRRHGRVARKLSAEGERRSRACACPTRAALVRARSFSSTLWHYSEPNRSSHDRRVYYAQFSSGVVSSAPPHSALPTRPLPERPLCLAVSCSPCPSLLAEAHIRPLLPWKAEQACHSPPPALSLVRLPHAAVGAEQLSHAIDCFADELRAMCGTKGARAEITLTGRAEAGLWLRPEEARRPGDGELLSFALVHTDDDCGGVACGGGSHVAGFICASLCVQGEHDRHWGVAQPPVSFAPSRAAKRRRAAPAPPFAPQHDAVGAEMLVWHLWVESAARGHGQAARLVEAVCAHASSECVARGTHATTKLMRLSAEVLRANPRGLAFWRSRLRGGWETPMGERAIMISAEWRDGPSCSSTPAAAQS